MRANTVTDAKGVVDARDAAEKAIDLAKGDKSSTWEGLASKKPERLNEWPASLPHKRPEEAKKK